MSLIRSCSPSALCLQTSGGSGGGEVRPKDPKFKCQGKHQSFATLPSSHSPSPCLCVLSRVLFAWHVCCAHHLGFGHLLLFPQSKASPDGLQESSCARKGFAPPLFMGPMACPTLCGYSSPWLGQPSTEICQQIKVNTQDLGQWKPF